MIWREVGEPINAFRVSKKGIAMKCGNCFQWGHNQRTCKAPDNSNKKAYKKKQKGQSGQSTTFGAKGSKKLSVNFKYYFVELFFQISSTTLLNFSNLFGFLQGTQQPNIGTQQSSQSRTKDNTSGSKKDKGKANLQWQQEDK